MLLLLCVRARRRMRSAWLAYEEKTMPLLKEEKPGLKMSQYKDLLWKMWQKAPENVSELGRGSTRSWSSGLPRCNSMDVLTLGLCCSITEKGRQWCCTADVASTQHVACSVQSGLIADAVSGAQSVPRSR